MRYSGESHNPSWPDDKALIPKENEKDIRRKQPETVSEQNISCTAVFLEKISSHKAPEKGQPLPKAANPSKKWTFLL